VAISRRRLLEPAQHFVLVESSAAKLAEQYGDIEQDKGGLKIGLLGSDQNSRTVNMLKAAAEKRGHEIVFINLKECYFKLDSNNHDVVVLRDHKLNDFDAVFPLIDNPNRLFGCAIVRHFESLGVYVINSAESISRTHNPLLALQILESNELPIPTTLYSSGPHHTEELIKLAGGAPLVIKFGNSFSDSDAPAIQLASDDEQAKNIINSDAAHHENLLIQRYHVTPDNLIKLLVVNGKVGFAQRSSDSSTIKPSEQEQQLAIKASKALRLKVAEVEILREINSFQVLSVSANTDLAGYAVTTKRDPAMRIVRALERGLGWVG